MHLESICRSTFAGGWIFSCLLVSCYWPVSGTSSSSLVNVKSSQLRKVTRQAASLPATCFLRYSQVFSSFLRCSQICSGILITFLVCSGFLTRQTPPLVASGLHVHWQMPLCLLLTLGASARPEGGFFWRRMLLPNICQKVYTLRSYPRLTTIYRHY